MNKDIPNLHCGACMKTFKTIEALNKHLAECPAAFYLHPLIYQSYAGNGKVGHPLSHFIQACATNAHLINRYAFSISDKAMNFERSKIHAQLCSALGLDYNKFRPFESSEITEIPTKEECKKILWQALFLYASDNFIEHPSLHNNHV